jgi:hypothetical protein
VGLFGSICSAVGRGLSAIGSAICSGVSSLCSRIGSVALGGAVVSFVTKLGIGAIFPAIEIVNTLILVSSVVIKIAETLGLKKEKEDEPDELAMKAEKDYMKPEDFDSTESYIEHLQEDIQLSKEEKEKLTKMSPEERSAYRATGTYLYTKAINEKLGFDTTGLKNPELVGLTTEILADLVKIQNVLSPYNFVVYNKYLQANGMGLKELSNYLHNRSKDILTDEKVQFALTDAMKEISPEISQNEINQKLYKLNIED